MRLVQMCEGASRSGVRLQCCAEGIWPEEVQPCPYSGAFTPGSHPEIKINFTSAAGILFIACKGTKPGSPSPPCLWSFQHAGSLVAPVAFPVSPWQQWLHRGAFVMDTSPSRARTQQDREYCWHCLSYLKCNTSRTCQIFFKNVLQILFFCFA